MNPYHIELKGEAHFVHYEITVYMYMYIDTQLYILLLFTFMTLIDTLF